MLCIVGTKFDLLLGGTPRGVSKEKVAHYARSLNALYFETSSKTGKNCTEPFVEAAKRYHKKPPKPKDMRFSSGNVSFQTDHEQQERRGCCR